MSGSKKGENPEEGVFPFLSAKFDVLSENTCRGRSKNIEFFVFPQKLAKDSGLFVNFDKIYNIIVNKNRIGGLNNEQD